MIPEHFENDPPVKKLGNIYKVPLSINRPVFADQPPVDPTAIAEAREFEYRGRREEDEYGHIVWVYEEK
jgi:hypothetical protein